MESPSVIICLILTLWYRKAQTSKDNTNNYKIYYVAWFQDILNIIIKGEVGSSLINRSTISLFDS